MGKILVYGNCLAAMVGALELAKNNNKVTLVNATEHWGGHFCPFLFDKKFYDPGMLMYEFDSFNEFNSDDISSYDPNVRNDVGRFSQIVKTYIDDLIPSNIIETPMMMINGEFIKDFLISNTFDFLKIISPIEKNQMIEELKSLLTENNQPFHPKFKHKNATYLNHSLYDISIANHGELFHQKFIEPYCKKILNISSKKVIALYHRICWLPMFYPETLLSYLNNSFFKKLKTNFHYPKNSYSTQITKILLNKIHNTENIELIEKAKIKKISVLDNLSEAEFSISSKNTNRSIIVNKIDKFAWGSSLNEFNNIFHKGILDEYEFKRTSVGMLFLSVESSNLKKVFSVLNIIDHKFSIYRITNQSFCAQENSKYRRLTVEFNINFYEDLYVKDMTDFEIAKNLFIELENMGILKNRTNFNEHKLLKIRNAFISPTEENYKIFKSEVSLFDKICKMQNLSILLVGPGAGFFSSSMNDQILQGLKLGRV